MQKQGITEVLEAKAYQSVYLAKVLNFLADIVELEIKWAIGPDSYVADGWSCAGIHYFAVLH